MLVVDVAEELCPAGSAPNVVEVVIEVVLSEVEESVVDEAVGLSEVEDELSVLSDDVEASVDVDEASVVLDEVSVVLDDVEIEAASGVTAKSGPGQSGHWKQVRS